MRDLLFFRFISSVKNTIAFNTHRLVVNKTSAQRLSRVSVVGASNKRIFSHSVLCARN